MIVLDANYILRYLLRDHEEMFVLAKETIENNHCLVLNEVVAEVVYVLEKVYTAQKRDTVTSVGAFLSQNNIGTVGEKSNILLALTYYQEENIDFVDGYLCSLKDEYQIKTFDKKLSKCLNA